MFYRKRIRDLREDHDKSQQDIAAVLGAGQGTYSLYERGVRELPLRHLITLCRYYRVSADYILGFTDEMRPLP
ncbi:MAG TPA: helix-turn-helix domain-containing protein [Firmicutes bacterium]|nr:helix-turn-helix domain-containing protein [Bacillota bacterium]